MSTLVTIILRPFLSLNSENGGKIGLVYPITVFFAFGIYLVFDRWQKINNSPIHFRYNIPVEADPTWKSLPIENASIESHLTSPEIAPHIQSDRPFITCFDPATGLHIATLLADNRDDILRKIGLAVEAQKTWKRTTFTQRRRVVRSLKKWLVDNQDICARVACRDTGKTLLDASLGEILTTCQKMEWLMKYGESYLQPERRHGNLIMAHKVSEVHYQPLGVVAGIVSWNYPLHNAWSPILAALYAGNGIVLKCSEKVVWSTMWFVGAVQACLRACGHNEELVQVVCCYPEEADTLTKSPLIKHITFIGSETVGRKVAMAATEHLTPVTLELGGKDPAIIMPGTDLNKWASVWMRGVYQNMGQNCIGIERLLVHQSQYDDLYALFVERVTKLRLGSVLAATPEGYVSTIDSGAMIDGERFEGLERLIIEAEEAGANVIGGKRYEHALLNNGYYFSPTVVGPVDPAMRITQQELFAPIALLMPYETVNEAIEIANGTRYGLGASVFGPSEEQCLEVAKELECGMVTINDFATFYVRTDLPFGGTKASGYGRFGGPEGLRSLTNAKAIMVDRWPALAQTNIPAVLDYPLRSLSKSWYFCSGLVYFLYGEGIRERLGALYTLFKASRG
ncbi:Aldedh-domain-containing protein [Fistulina hepatica ATCC 64428]|nr:Aldedh-domain-containing protein [Fistulina hepatica ATCC 64428]